MSRAVNACWSAVLTTGLGALLFATPAQAACDGSILNPCSPPGPPAWVRAYELASDPRGGVLIDWPAHSDTTVSYRVERLGADGTTWEPLSGSLTDSHLHDALAPVPRRAYRVYQVRPNAPGSPTSAEVAAGLPALTVSSASGCVTGGAPVSGVPFCTLVAAYVSSPPGSTITLEPGSWSASALTAAVRAENVPAPTSEWKRWVRATGVTVTGVPVGSTAPMPLLTLTNVRYLQLTGLTTIVAGLKLVSAQDVTVEGLVQHHGKLVTTNGTRILVTDSEFSERVSESPYAQFHHPEVWAAVEILGGSGITVSNNRFHDLVADAVVINAHSTQPAHITITGNRAWRLREYAKAFSDDVNVRTETVPGNGGQAHTDFVQVTDHAQTVSGLIITHNVVFDCLQGLILATQQGISGLRIESNVIAPAWDAIRLMGSDGAIIAHNTFPRGRVSIECLHDNPLCPYGENIVFVDNIADSAGFLGRTSPLSSPFASEGGNMFAHTPAKPGAFFGGFTPSSSDLTGTVPLFVSPTPFLPSPVSQDDAAQLAQARANWANTTEALLQGADWGLLSTSDGCPGTTPGLNRPTANGRDYSGTLLLEPTTRGGGACSAP